LPTEKNGNGLGNSPLSVVGRRLAVAPLDRNFVSDKVHQRTQWFRETHAAVGTELVCIYAQVYVYDLAGLQIDKRPTSFLANRVWAYSLLGS